MSGTSFSTYTLPGLSAAGCQVLDGTAGILGPPRAHKEFYLALDALDELKKVPSGSISGTFLPSNAKTKRQGVPTIERGMFWSCLSRLFVHGTKRFRWYDGSELVIPLWNHGLDCSASSRSLPNHISS